VEGGATREIEQHAGTWVHVDSPKRAELALWRSSCHN
jgi:hypothetical protein